MKSRAEKAAEKKIAAQREIAAFIGKFNAAAKSLKVSAKQFQNTAKELALRGQNENAKKFLRAAAKYEMLSEKVESAAITMKANVTMIGTMDVLKDIPGVVDACNTLVGKMPNMDNIEKGIETITKAADDAMSMFDKLGDKLSPSGNDLDLFGTVSADNEALERRFRDMERALEAELAIGSTAAAPVSGSAFAASGANAGASAAQSASASNAASIDDIAAMIDEERNK